MILPALLFSFFCAGKPAELKARVIGVAEGSDVSLNCSLHTDESEWLRRKLNTILRLNTAKYLLIKDFQSRDVGYYYCNNKTHQQTFYLELKYGSMNEQLHFFRGSEGDSVLFFCKTLSASLLQARWSWTPHNSSQSIQLYQNCQHFNNRIQFRNKENDFSLKISPVKWSDSGKYSCYRDSTDRQSVYDLVLVRVVRADLEQKTLSHSVRFKCECSHQTTDFHALWMNTETQETFSDPLEVKDVTLSQQNWMCAVFYSSMLKGVFPLTLNITHAFTTAPPSSPTPPHHTPYTEPETPMHTTANNFTHNDAGHGHSHAVFIIIGVFIIFILVAMVTAVLCTKTPKETKESVTYSEVIFRKKSDSPTEPQRNSTDVPAEEEVVYATINLF